jgi:hypothetical protein
MLDSVAPTKCQTKKNKTMKKILTILTTATIVATALVSCDKDPEPEKEVKKLPSKVESSLKGLLLGV